MKSMQFAQLTRAQKMLGTILNDKTKLAEELPIMKKGKFSPEVQEIIEAIEDPDKPFKDIYKKCGMSGVAFAMLLANICECNKINRNYEKGCQ